MENKQAILLLSGGIDSTTLLAKLAKENYSIVAISFHYGQKHSVELNYAKQNAQKYGVKSHHIIELNKILFESSALVNSELNITTFKNNELPNEQVNAYVPFRNLLFISTSLSLAETMNINEIYIAINKEDSSLFWDCTTDFIDKINSIANINSSIKIIAPFINKTKSEVIQLAQKLFVDIENTITCYQPKGKFECGICLSCITKQKAMENIKKYITKNPLGVIRF